ncbi:unnamed protein product [Parajaminaea phylloscopi]
MVAAKGSAPQADIHKPNSLVAAWFLVSSFVVFWDLSYLFARPHSFKALDGRLAHLWPGYELYETIDGVYSIMAWQSKRGFPAAQATMNVVENVFNFTYLWLAHSSQDGKRAVAPVVGLTGAVMTCSKTILYFLCDYYCDFCESGKNSWSRWVLLYLLPNGSWIVIPGIISIYLGLEIAGRLRRTAGVGASAPSAPPSEKVKAVNVKGGQTS